MQDVVIKVGLPHNYIHMDKVMHRAIKKIYTSVFIV